MRVLTVMCTTTAMGTGGQGEMLSEYSVEYSTALLMNLSLRTEGKARAAKEEVGVGRPLASYLCCLLAHTEPLALCRLWLWTCWPTF